MEAAQGEPQTDGVQETKYTPDQLLDFSFTKKIKRAMQDEEEDNESQHSEQGSVEMESVSESSQEGNYTDKEMDTSATQ